MAGCVGGFVGAGVEGAVVLDARRRDVVSEDVLRSCCSHHQPLRKGVLELEQDWFTAVDKQFAACAAP